MEQRCPWAGAEPIYIDYHDKEWGVPVHDDRTLFEFLILEGAQAGLSWITILKRRDNYRKAFDNFDPVKVAQYDEAKQQELLQDPGIIRNRLKISAAIDNAKAFIKVQEEFGSFDIFLASFFKDKIRKNALTSLADIPAETPESKALSKELKRRGFRFVGPTIMYAFMQAVGIVNDHLVTCFRYKELEEKK